MFVAGCSQSTPPSQVAAKDVPGQQPENQAVGPKNDLSDRSNEQLIDALTEIDKPVLGIHPTAWASGFLADNENPKFRGGVLGSEKPTVVPAMCELVRRGVEAMPTLLARLDDKRPTKLKVRPWVGGAWHS